jgi:hypothetical protein
VGSIPTASTISKAALRGLDQLQDLQGGFGLKVRPAATRVDQIASLSCSVSGPLFARLSRARPPISW